MVGNKLSYEIKNSSTISQFKNFIRNQGFLIFVNVYSIVNIHRAMYVLYVIVSFT